MLTAILRNTENDNDKFFLIGLSFANLKQFQENPMNTYIEIPADRSGLELPILIVSGETEEEIRNVLLARMRHMQ